MLVSGGTSHLLWYALGAVIGVALVAVVGRSFVVEHGARKAMPWVVGCAVVVGATLAWALGAWNDFMHASATLPGM